MTRRELENNIKELIEDYTFDIIKTNQEVTEKIMVEVDKYNGGR